MIKLVETSVFNLAMGYYRNKSHHTPPPARDKFGNT